MSAVSEDVFSRVAPCGFAAESIAGFAVPSSAEASAACGYSGASGPAGTPRQPWWAVAISALRPVAEAIVETCRRAQTLPALKKRPRRLRVSETLSLGDKRFVSILEVDGQSFLIGGSSAGLALLAGLQPQQMPFESFLHPSPGRDEVR